MQKLGCAPEWVWKQSGITREVCCLKNNIDKDTMIPISYFDKK